MSSIAEVFARCRSEKRAAFIPYLTAGDPDAITSMELMRALVRGGADLIEIGVPFSDPIADGPTNQRAAKRALDAGTDLAAVLALAARVRSESEVPIVLFTYLNPLLSQGLESFAEQAAKSGVNGVLCVDLPPDEAAREYLPVMRQQGIETVFLLAPTSTSQRIREVGAASTGFVYYVSRTGVTGARDDIRSDLQAEVKRVRKRLKLPLAVGFGISTPDQVGEVGRIADGVVVGSALVRLIEGESDLKELPVAMESKVRQLVAALR
ncbi:MAG: tryptophan synthase subunit alpha [Acidobacteriota bacterium]